eukprot:TRINITY_DN24041_c0_g1_i2.p1 TRINITY_DN24041_c0_g1~~TRINITY_DN24041_c0_g1_i2.p1  ORF type:complete len:558 (-),score=116.86 TRINITY_DN24041_c0_g1_i2:197-1756(-)
MGCSTSTPQQQPAAQMRQYDPEKGDGEYKVGEHTPMSMATVSTEEPSPRSIAEKSTTRDESKEPLLAESTESDSQANVTAHQVSQDADAKAAEENVELIAIEEKTAETSFEQQPGDARTAALAAPEAAPSATQGLQAYFGKFAGAGVAGMPRPPLTQTAFSFFGSFTGIAILGLLHGYLLTHEHLVLLIPPFGAMAVLVFSACSAPLAQPRNVIVGNTIGGFIGWMVFKVMALAGLGNLTFLGAAMAVSLTIVAQEQAKAVHPPGGATALAFVIVPPLHALDYKYIICPSLLGAVILVVVGLFTNNLSAERTYPQGWGFGLGNSRVAAEDSGPKAYFKKFQGLAIEGPPAPAFSYSGFSFMGAFLGIATLGLFDTYLSPTLPQLHLKFLIASFGAMAVLLYSAQKAPLAQPRNVLLGNTIGGLVGVSVVKLLAMFGLGKMLWLNAALAVSLTIVLQELTASVHPPGGATALVYVVLPLLRPLGFEYVISPAFLGAAILLVIALFTNNLSTSRAYPQGWW